MRFFDKARQYYLKKGYDYKEATRHAKADEDFWYEIFMGKKRG